MTTATLSKKEQLKQIVDEENLESPVNSVEFLQYVKKHQQKVETQKQRLATMSRALMFIGVAGIALVVYRSVMSARAEEHHTTYSGRQHRLGASNTAVEESNAYGQTFSALSMAIWGLVVTKAKAGQEACSSKDAQSVGGIVKKVGTICALIACASMFQLMGSLNTANPVEAVQKATSSGHKLQSSHQSHPASYYDKTSSHYMGGAHNRLIEAAKSGELSQAAVKPQQMQPTEVLGHNLLIDFAQKSMGNASSVAMPSMAAMGGAHNVAMQVIAQKSNEFKNARKNTQTTSASSYFRTTQASQAQYQKNLQGTLSFLGFIATLAVCMYYYVIFKTYHAHLQKQDSLNALLNNPNARVASGKKGKAIMKKLMGKHKELKAKAEPKKAESASSIDALLEAAKTRNVEEAVTEKLLTGYKPPVVEATVVAAPAPIIVQQPQVNYQLIEPVAAAPVKPTVVTNSFANQYWYPQNFEVTAPLPVPQVVTQPISKVAIQQPEPMREPLPTKQADLAALPKADLIKALLTQLSKEE